MPWRQTRNILQVFEIIIIQIANQIHPTTHY